VTRWWVPTGRRHSGTPAPVGPDWVSHEGIPVCAPGLAHRPWSASTAQSHPAAAPVPSQDSPVSSPLRAAGWNDERDFFSGARDASRRAVVPTSGLRRLRRPKYDLRRDPPGRSMPRLSKVHPKVRTSREIAYVSAGRLGVRGRRTQTGRRGVLTMRPDLHLPARDHRGDAHVGSKQVNPSFSARRQAARKGPSITTHNPAPSAFERPPNSAPPERLARRRRFRGLSG